MPSSKPNPYYSGGAYSEKDAAEFLNNSDVDDLIRARSGNYWTKPGKLIDKPIWRSEKEGAITTPLSVCCETPYSEVENKLYKICPEDEPPPPGPPTDFETQDIDDKIDDLDKNCREEKDKPSTGSTGSLPADVFSVEPSFFREGAAPFGQSPNLTVYFFDGAVIDGYRYVTGRQPLGEPFQRPDPIEYEGQLYYELKRLNPGGGFEGQPSLYVRNIEPNKFGVPGLEFSLSDACKNLFTGATKEECISGRPDAPNLRSDHMIVSINPFPNSSSGSDREFRYYNFSTGQVVSTDNQNKSQPKFNILKDSDEFFNTKEGYRLYKIRESLTGSGSKVFTSVYVPPAPQEELQQEIFNMDNPFVPYPSDPNSLKQFVVFKPNKQSPLYKKSQQAGKNALNTPNPAPTILFEKLICGGPWTGITYIPDPGVSVGGSKAGLSQQNSAYQSKVKKWILEKGLVLNRQYEDYSFDYRIPYSKREAEKIGGASTVMYAQVDPVYNFYIEEYENAIKSNAVDQKILPNLYAMKSIVDFDSSNSSPTNILNPAYRELLTLDELIKYKNVTSLNFQEAKGQYFDQWGRTVNREIFEAESSGTGVQSFIESQAALATKYTNLAVTHSNVDFLKDADIDRELFPMFVDIELSTTKNTPFSNLLEETDFSGLLLKEIISNFPDPLIAPPGTNEFGRFLGVAIQDYPQPSEDVTAEELATYQPRTQISFKNRRCLDLLEWIENTKAELQNSGGSNTNPSPEDSIESVEGGATVFLGNVSDIVQLGSDPKYSFYKHLVLLAFEAKLKQLTDKHTRTYCDILNGELAFNETVFYKIEKRLNTAGGPIIQNIYLPNSTKIDVLKYIDTQVKYGETYTYTIYSYELVYGSAYRYDDYRLGDDCAGVNVSTTPKAKIFEMRLFSYTNTLLDSPPVSPDVNIIPYRAVDNKIKIAFNSGTGSCEKFPIIIESSESNQVSKLLAAQDKYQDEKLLYESDDQTTKYEVWRIDHHPFGYEDFAGNKIKTLITDIDLKSPQKPTSGAVIDMIQPNKKYWYVFRSVDVHNHTSYPSPVYEIELIEDLGAVFPRIEIVDFAERIQKVPTKKGKRMIHIVPKIGHTVVNEEASGLTDKDSVLDRWPYGQFKLGVKEESIWRKKFKFRLTSSKTCRKVDINVEFDTRHRKIEPE